MTSLRRLFSKILLHF